MNSPAQLIPVQVWPRVLIIGSAPVAGLLVDRLTAIGVEAVWAGGKALEGKAQGEQVIPEAELIAFTGLTGRFRAVFSTLGDRQEIQAGAVVLCSEELRVPYFTPQPGRILTVSTAEEELAGKGFTDWLPGGPRQIALVAGAGQVSSVGTIRRMMALAGKLVERTKGSVYFFAPHVKVASSGLERLYGQLREKGVVFLRTPEQGPSFDTSGERIRIRLFDPVARAELSLIPDLVIVEEALRPAPQLAAWADLMGLELAPDRFIGPDNVLYWPVLTNRRGIYALGPARGTDDEEQLAGQVSAVITEISNLLGTTQVQVPPVALQSNRCASCLTCLRVCPHGAIDFDYQPSFHPLACQACGTCASTCPGQAISYDGLIEPDLRARMGTALTRPKVEEGFSPRLMLFGCQRSAMTALEAVSGESHSRELAVQALPCGGYLDVNLVLTSLQSKGNQPGADGVMIAVCHQDNCRSMTGSPTARQRFTYLQSILKTISIEPTRLGLVTLAPNMGMELKHMIKEFRDRVLALGPLGTR